MRLFRHAAAGTFILIGAYALAPCVATAQSLALAGGVAIPRGPMADRRAVGQQISLAISPSYRVRGRTVRGELTQSWFPRTASYAATRPGQQEGTLSITSAAFYLVLTAGPHPVSPHIGIGGGVSRMNIPGYSNRCGTIAQVGWLMGAKIGTGRVRGLVEMQDQLIVSDYGNDEFEASRFVPLRVGVSVERIR